MTRLTVLPFDDARLLSLRDRLGLTVEGSAAQICDLDADVPDPFPAEPARGEVVDTVEPRPAGNPGGLTEVDRIPRAPSYR